MTANIDGQTFVTRIVRINNKVLAKVAIQYSAEKFVVNQILVLPINICGKNGFLQVTTKGDAKV
jgi:hypothetical protein